MPLYRYNRHKFKVTRVIPEARGVVSIYVGGQNIESFRFIAGQYAIWRFLTPDLWLQAHPFSFSVAPGDKELRLTVKAVGDFTELLQRLQPGAPVVIDGPHGDFTLPADPNHSLIFIAGGIGITPLRAMIEALPENSSSPTLIYAARTKADLALHKELETLLDTRGGKAHYVLSEEKKHDTHSGPIDQTLLKRLVPDIVHREILLCGPPPMMTAVQKMLKQIGVPRSRIHHERFAFIEARARSRQTRSKER